MILQVVILTFLIVWLVLRWWQRRKFVKLFQQFDPKRISLPFIGHAYWFLGKNGEERMDKFKLLGEMSYERGGLVSFWQGNRLYLLVSDPASAKTIMKTCLEKDDVYAIFRGLTGNGSIFAQVSFWRSRRKAISPAFGQKNLNPFMGIFNQQSRVLVSQLKNLVGKSCSVGKMMASFTFDVVCESSLGIKANSQLDPTNPFINRLAEVGKVMCERTVQPWLHSEAAYRVLPQSKHYYGHIRFMNDFVYKIIKPKLDLREQGHDIIISESVKARKEQPEFKTFLQILLETTRLDANEIKEEMLVAVIAGTDTTAVTLSFTAFLLAAHPRVQEACYKELQEVFGESDRAVTLEDLPRLKYLELAIKESMRLYPAVPLVLRKVENDVELPSGTTLVAGCGIFISIFAMHRNPKYWGNDADKFRPERFEQADSDHAAYMPFSYGLRGCVGSQYAMMVLKTSLATLLRRYRIVPAKNQTCTQDKPIRIKLDITTKDVEDIEIGLECRKNTELNGILANHDFCRKLL